MTTREVFALIKGYQGAQKWLIFHGLCTPILPIRDNLIYVGLVMICGQQGCRDSPLYHDTTMIDDTVTFVGQQLWPLSCFCWKMRHPQSADEATDTVQRNWFRRLWTDWWRAELPLSSPTACQPSVMLILFCHERWQYHRARQSWWANGAAGFYADLYNSQFTEDVAED